MSSEEHSYQVTRVAGDFLKQKAYFAKYSLKHIAPNLGEFRKTMALKNTKRGKHCFVFGNGPSMSRLDPAKLKTYQDRGYDFFCVNSYVSSEFFNHLKPNFYIASDRGYYGDSTVTSDMPIELQKKIPSQIEAVNACGATAFVPVQFKSGNRYKNSYYFNDFEDLFSGGIHPLKPRGYLSLSALKALSMAHYMGYEKKYLCGLDHNHYQKLAVDEKNRMSYQNEHFYNPKGKKVFLDEYSGGMSEYFWQVHLTFKSFRLFSACGAINLVPNGLIDAFSKEADLDVFA